MQSAGERADQLSRFATYLDDPSLVNEQVDRYQAVTVEQVNAWAREFMGADNRAYLVYVPKDEPGIGDPGSEMRTAALAGVSA